MKTISLIFEKAIEKAEKAIKSTGKDRYIKFFILENEKSSGFSVEINFCLTSNDKVDMVFINFYPKDVLEEATPEEIIFGALKEALKQLSEEREEKEDD